MTPHGDAATTVADPAAPEAPPDADHPGTFVSQRTGGKVRITCSSNPREAEKAQDYAGAVAASADFRCLEHGGVPRPAQTTATAQPTVVAQATPDAASAQRRESGGGDSAGRDRGTRGLKADAKTFRPGQMRGRYHPSGMNV